MLPMVEVPATIRKGLRPYRDLFRRGEGFEHVSRYVTGLIVSPNKTLPGIYANRVWEGDKPSRRAMHEAVFEAGGRGGGIITAPSGADCAGASQAGRGSAVVGLDVGPS